MMNPTSFRESNRLDAAHQAKDESALFKAALSFSKMVVGVKLNRKEPELSSDIASKIVMGTFDGSAKFSTWAWTIASNAIASWLRDKYDEKHLVPLEQAEHVPSTSLVDRIDKRKHIQQTLSSLSPPDRELVELRLDDVPFRVIGDKLGISTTRAFERWKEILKELEEKYNAADK